MLERSYHSSILSLLISVVALLFFNYKTSAFSEQKELRTETSEKTDAVLVLDASGSMRLTDPKRLRDEGARLFIQFLKQGDRLGIIEFDQNLNIVRPLSDFNPHQTDSIAKAIGSVGKEGLYTDLLSSIEAAVKMIMENKRDNVSPVIVLLSDGKMEPDPAKGSAQIKTNYLLDTVLPNVKKDGIKIHTLAFSEMADKDLLKQIASITGGVNWFTMSPDDIYKSYADLFLVVKRPQVVPLTSKGFKIDANIQEATFYINRESAPDVNLISPSGTRHASGTSDSKVRWFRGERFDVITVTEPETGNWQIEGISSDDGFATVLTNLKLVTDWPVSIKVDQKVLLQARLYESDKPVVLPEMTGAVKYGFQVTSTDKVAEPMIRAFLNDEGKDGDLIPKDGIFSTEVIIKEEGEYRLRVAAQGPTFQRNQEIPFRVKPELVRVSVVNVDESSRQVPKTEGQVETVKPLIGELLRVTLSPDTSDLKKLEVKLNVVDPNRKKYSLRLQAAPESKYIYEASVDSLTPDVPYEVKASISGEERGGKQIKEESKSISYTKKVGEKKEEELNELIEVPVEKEPEKPKETPLILGVLILFIVNGVAGVGAVRKLKKLQGKTTLSLPELPVFAPLVSEIEKISAQHSGTEFNVSDPKFNTFVADEKTSTQKVSKKSFETATKTEILEEHHNTEPEANLGAVNETTETKGTEEDQEPPTSEELDE